MISGPPMLTHLTMVSKASKDRLIVNPFKNLFLNIIEIVAYRSTYYCTTRKTNTNIQRYLDSR